MRWGWHSWTTTGACGGWSCGGIDCGDDLCVKAIGELTGLQRPELGDLELAVLIFEDVIFGLGGAMDLVVCVGLVLHELRRDLFCEEDLSVVGGVACGVGLVRFMAVEADFEVDVIGAAHVEAGEDGAEVDEAVWRGDLNAAEEGEPVGGMVLRWRTEALGWAGMIVRMLWVESVWWFWRWANL
jgi:hypothetical protein